MQSLGGETMQFKRIIKNNTISIGKSKPSLMINLCSPRFKGYESLSRDGTSPEYNQHRDFTFGTLRDIEDFGTISPSSLSDTDDMGAADQSSCCSNATMNQRSDICRTVSSMCNLLCDTKCGQSPKAPSASPTKNVPNAAKSQVLSSRKEFMKGMLEDEKARAEAEAQALKSNFSMDDFRERMAIAEALAKASMMTTPAAKRRLAARKIELEMTSDDEGDYVPPKDLLVYLVRMGSFNSAPKINNVDSQDDGVQIPQGLTVTDLVHHCQLMRGEHRPPLLSRYFLKPVSSPLISKDIADGVRVLQLNSVSKVCSSPTSSPNHVRLLQWNLLSQSLGQNNDGFVCCPEEALTWEARKYLIVQEIVQNDPDIICLQEVDHFKFLQQVLGTQNYEGVFYPKPDSPCLYIKENNGPDGCAIFYKKNKFELVNSNNRVLEVWRVQSNQVAIAANFRVLESNKEFAVCTTHLKARHGALLSKLRNEQGKDLLRFVEESADGRPVLLSGDFNAEPIEPVYGTILGYEPLDLSSAYSDLLAKNDNSNGVPVTEKNDAESSCVKSLPEKSAATEPAYTTWKIREAGEVCHTIDYVFYSKDRIKVNNCLMFPDDKEVGKNRTPSYRYPSDHFSLVCDFEFLDN